MLTHGPQRQSADGAHLLLELVRQVGVYRQVTGVVRPGRELIDEQPIVFRPEKLDTQYADHIQNLEDGAIRFRRADLSLCKVHYAGAANLVVRINLVSR